MDDAVAVRIADGFEHLRENPCGQMSGHWAVPVQLLGKHAPGDELHHQVITAVVFAEGE